MSSTVAQRYFDAPNFGEYFADSHSAGALDEKTKWLIHLAVTLALKCEPCVVNTLGRLERAGASPEEINETIQVASSVGAGAMLAMADRARDAANAGHYWWRTPRESTRRT
jgi:AhpD family alkylhydroperoxidase